jgi:hypothetical protein
LVARLERFRADYPYRRVTLAASSSRTSPAGRRPPLLLLTGAVTEMVGRRRALRAALR